VPVDVELYSLPDLIFLTWVTGSLLTFILMLLRQAVAMKRRGIFVRVRRGDLVQNLEIERRRAGLKKPPNLFVAGEWVMPSTWGFLRPAILLPREAAEWPLPKLQHVLWHEMAHISRRDSLTSFLTSPAAILLWFNPLVWIALQQSRQLREAACDDWVLTRGQAEGPAYSADLLDIVRQHSRHAVSVGGMAMAQSSKVGSRVHRLLHSSARRESPGMLSRISLTTGWGVLTAFTTLLISCRTPGPVSTAAAPEPAVIAISAHARPGNAIFQFGLIEITETVDTAKPYLKAAEDASAGALASESLRDLSQRRGVDLLSLPKVREGQKVDYFGGAYRLNLSGEKSASGNTIRTKASINIEGRPTPLTFASLRIPNGGFVVLPGTFQPASPKDKTSRSRVLALTAASDPLPRKSGGDMETFPLPGDASLPSGAKLISYGVHFIEKEPGVNWPGNKVPPTQTWTGEAHKLLSSLKRKRGISVVSYPKVTALAGSEVIFKSGTAWSESPKPSPRVDPFDSNPQAAGVFIKLSGKPAPGDGLHLDVDWKSKNDVSSAKGTEETFPKTQTTGLSSKCFLSNGNDCALISFSPHIPGNTALESILMITTTQTVNP
jgi:hypothetical protein